MTQNQNNISEQFRTLARKRIINLDRNAARTMGEEAYYTSLIGGLFQAIGIYGLVNVIAPEGSRLYANLFATAYLTGKFLSKLSSRKENIANRFSLETEIRNQERE